MAAKGIYWSGNECEPDTVTCYVCYKTLDCWELTDDPWKEHSKLASQFNFVKYGRKEVALTVDEFINLLSIALKAQMEQNLNNTMEDFRKWAEKERDKLLLSK